MAARIELSTKAFTEGKTSRDSPIARVIALAIDKHNVDPSRALKRLAVLLKERLRAYGAKWKKWCDTHVHTTKQSTIPIKYQERGIISQDIFGHYTINPEIQKWHDAI